MVVVLTAVGLGEAVKDTIKRAAFTFRESVVETDFPTESFTNTRTVKAPDVVGVHTKEATLDVAHPPGRPAYAKWYGMVPPETETPRVVAKFTSVGLGRAVKDMISGSTFTVTFTAFEAEVYPETPESETTAQ
jgi:hypothetical protein